MRVYRSRKEASRPVWPAYRSTVRYAVIRCRGRFRPGIDPVQYRLGI